MKALTYFLIILALAGVGALVAVTNLPTAQPQTDAQTLRIANELYANGQYAEAARMYHQLVDGGARNSDLFYNLGNAYFQQGDLGNAVLYYRRALALSPRDPDIQANLALARSRVSDDSTRPVGNTLLRVVHLADAWLTMNESAVIAFGLWLVVAVLYVLSRHTRGALRRLASFGMVTLGLLLIVGVSILGARLYVERMEPAAVVVGAGAALAANPGAEASSALAVPAGSEVHLLAEQNGWVQVLLPGRAVIGWLPADAVVPVASAVA